MLYKRCGVSIGNIKYGSCILYSLGRVDYMSRKQQPGVKKRNIALNSQTYKRLETLKANLIKEKGNPNLTYDDVINALLDEHTP